jgi:hypothetical protein
VSPACKRFPWLKRYVDMHAALRAPEGNAFSCGTCGGWHVR